MRPISQVVAETLRESPFFEEAISEGVGNNAEIARRIKPEVEKRLLEEVSEAAIAMALHRLSKEIRKRPLRADFFKNISDITVRSNLVEFIFSHPVELSPVMAALSRVAKKRKDAFINFSRGLYQSLLIVNRELEKDITASAKKENARIVRGLSAITMRLSPESVDEPGVYHPILKALAREGISFVEVMSVDTEFSIIFRDLDIDRAFSVIKRLTS